LKWSSAQLVEIQLQAGEKEQEPEAKRSQECENPSWLCPAQNVGAHDNPQSDLEHHDWQAQSDR
jgi:hypothetical protein